MPHRTGSRQSVPKKWGREISGPSEPQITYRKRLSRRRPAGDPHRPLKRRANSPGLGGCLDVGENRECLAVDAVESEPVSEFPENREFTGKIRDFRPPRASFMPEIHATSMSCAEIPYHAEQGIFRGPTGNGHLADTAEQGRLPPAELVNVPPLPRAEGRSVGPQFVRRSIDMPAPPALSPAQLVPV